MKPLELANAYFAAWNAHDADAITATFAADGTYTDPATDGPLTGDAIARYAQGLWEAFPDVAFEIRSAAEMADGRVVGEWTMRGTNGGPFAGLPPTGQNVTVPGVDLIETGPGGITAVTGYFDSRAIPAQLGLQVLVQPATLGPFTFGNSVTVQSGNTAKPGAFSITTIWNEDDGTDEIRGLSVETAQQMLGMEGFIGLALLRAGRRGVTITAWEKPEQAKQLRQSEAHRKAMTRFWADLGDAGFTSVWQPERINPFWVRCRDCGKMNEVEKRAGECECGSSLPEAPAWF